MLAVKASGSPTLCAIALSVCICGAALAETFPERPIRIIVGFGPGGLGDMVSRSVAEKLTSALGKQVYIENSPSAGGIAAAVTAKRAKPDGYTMLLVSGQNAASPSLFPSLPYDMNADFAMVSTIALFNFVIMVAKDSPYQSLADLVAAAKKAPGKFNFGTISHGSVQNLSAQLFKSTTGLETPVVTFKTTGEVQIAVMTTTVQASFETLPGAISQIRSNTLRPLAVTSKQRLPYLPDVPTASESGIPGYNLQSWSGYVVPAKTPPRIVSLLNKEIGAAIAAPDLQKRFVEMGLTAYASTPDEMKKFYDEDVVRWQAVIANSNVQQ